MAAWRVKTPATQLQSFPVWVSLVQRAAGCERVEVTPLSACTTAERWGKAMTLYLHFIIWVNSQKNETLFYLCVFFFHWLMPFCFGFGFKFHTSGKIRVNSNLIEFGSTSNQNPTWINYGVWKRKMWQRIVLLNCTSRAFDKVVNRENGHNCICRWNITLNTYFRAIYHQVFTFILRQKLWKN